MSLVGTRPILPDELEQYELHHRAKDVFFIANDASIMATRAVAPYAAQIFTHLSVVSSRQRSYDWLRCEGLKNEMEM